MDFFPPVDKLHASNVNSLVLAYIGDAVHSLFARQKLVLSGDNKANVLHTEVSKIVNAHTQSLIASKAVEILTDDELAVFKRARNSSVSHSAKNQSKYDYKKATALEAVIGYLYLTGQVQRIKELLEIEIL